MSFDAELYRRLLETSPEGVVLVDAQAQDQPVIYVNPGFEHPDGLPRGRSLGPESSAAAGEMTGNRTAAIVCARRSGSASRCRVLLRNYRKDGTLFWNEMTVLPLKDPDGRVTHFAGHHRDAGDRLRIDPEARARFLERRASTDRRRRARRPT